jgi:hypothetical protein
MSPDRRKSALAKRGRRQRVTGEKIEECQQQVTGANQEKHYGGWFVIADCRDLRAGKSEYREYET